MRGQRGSDDRVARNGEGGREVGTEVAAVLLVDRVLTERNERPAPPLDVVIAGNDEHRRGLAAQIGECPAALKLAMASAL